MKIKPYVFLFILLIVLFFILGVRYGERVEKTNKTINYLVSIAPTKPIPTQLPLKFETYKNSDCGVNFMYPSTATSTADFEVDCQKKSRFLSILNDVNIATEEVILQNKKIKGKNQNDRLIFSSINFRNGKTVYFSITRTLFPLFNKTFEFVF
jgi:hypothetical protein